MPRLGLLMVSDLQISCLNCTDQICSGLLIAASVWAANAKSYNEHLGARMLLGFAAGQSEALVPMMIQVRTSD